MMKSRLLVNLLLLLLTIVFCLAGGETVLRLLDHTDTNGNIHLLGRTLKPYRLPIRTTRETIAHYQRAHTAKLIYDAELGWVNRPSTTFLHEGICYHYDQWGLRSEPDMDHSLEAEPGVFRIALFGDSFTHGDEVGWDQTWAGLLERRLRERGRAVEVLNFGVGGYGIDQIYLSWLVRGRSFRPDLVVLGFQAVDVRRNLSIIRPLFTPQLPGIPFSKPRFVFQGDRLELVNSPTLPLSEIVPTLERIEEWELLPHEFYYQAWYRPRLWQGSRLFALAATALGHARSPVHPSRIYQPDGEPARLTLELVSLFRESVLEAGVPFLVVNLPVVTDLKDVREGRRLSYNDLLTEVEAICAVVRPSEALIGAAPGGKLGPLFRGKGHYSAVGNRIVAQALAGPVAETMGPVR